MVSAFIKKIVDKSLESVLNYLEIDRSILQTPKPFRIRIVDDVPSSGSWKSIALNPSWSPDLQATAVEEATHGLYQRLHDPTLRYYKIAKLPYEEQLYLNAVQEFIAGLMRLIMHEKQNSGCKSRVYTFKVLANKSFVFRHAQKSKGFLAHRKTLFSQCPENPTRARRASKLWT